MGFAGHCCLGLGLFEFLALLLVGGKQSVVLLVHLGMQCDPPCVTSPVVRALERTNVLQLATGRVKLLQSWFFKIEMAVLADVCLASLISGQRRWFARRKRKALWVSSGLGPLDGRIRNFHAVSVGHLTFRILVCRTFNLLFFGGFVDGSLLRHGWTC